MRKRVGVKSTGGEKKRRKKLSLLNLSKYVFSRQLGKIVKVEAINNWERIFCRRNSKF